MLTTTNYQFKKIELKDSPPDITIINPNWDTIDVELKKAADLKAQYDALKIGAVNLKNFTDFNKITVLDGSTEWTKGGSGAITLKKNVSIAGVEGLVTVANINNTNNVESALSSGIQGETLIIQAKPNTEYTLSALLSTTSIEGVGAYMQIMERAADGTAIKGVVTSAIKMETPFTKYTLTLKTSTIPKWIEIRFGVNGIGSLSIYQPMLVEGNKIVEGWSPSLADID